jgi:hypothetical protein
MVHLSKSGHAAIAAALADEIRRAELIPAARRPRDWQAAGRQLEPHSGS